MRPDLVRGVRRVSFSGWTYDPEGHEMPLFRDDPNGNAIVVTDVDSSIVHAEYARAFSNPAAWGRANSWNSE
jgi:hypothetical protein